MLLSYIVVAVAFLVHLLCLFNQREVIVLNVGCSSDEIFWRSIAGAILVPLMIDYILDLVMEFASYCVADEIHIAEDKNDHGLVVCSLIPVSCIPLWTIGKIWNRSYHDGLLNVANLMLVSGVVGKLQTFSGDVWQPRESAAVIIVYAIGEIACIIGERLSYEENALYFINYHLLAIAFSMKILAAIMFITSSRNFRLVFRESKREPPRVHDLFTTRSYLCTMLFVGLSWFFIQTSRFLVRSWLVWPTTLFECVEARLFLLITSVVMTGVLPGRIIRRGIKAVYYARMIQRELNNKKTFVSYIAHEVRSTLSSSALGLDCVLEMVEKRKKIHRSELRDILVDTRSSCTKALRTLNDLLLFDKIENSMIDLELQVVSCRSFLISCMKPFVLQLKNAGIEFKVEIDERLTNMVFSIDRVKMEQVLRNFISNAAKFTPPGGMIHVKAVLQMDLSSGGPSANGAGNSKAEQPTESGHVVFAPPPMNMRVEVTDTGVGISEENLRRLFAQYVQIDAERLQEGKGSGLGLWISRSIVTMHHGTVGAYSAGEHQGSTFFFELSCHEGHPEEDTDEETIDQSLSLSDENHLTISSAATTPIRAPLNRETRLLQASLLRSRTEEVKSFESPMDELTPFSIHSTTDSPSTASGTESNLEAAPIEPTCVEEKGVENENPKPLKILIADDALIARKLVARMLSAAIPNSEIYHAINGAEAAAAVIASMKSSRGAEEIKSSLPESRPFDAVIIDYYMPNVNGPEAIQEMRKAGFEGLVFGVTAASSYERSNFLSAGANYIMLKPFDIKMFVRIVCEKFGDQLVQS